MADYSKEQVLDIVEAAAKKNGVPRDDFLRFTAIETGFTYDERARNPSSGAKGLFQFLPETARQYGIAGREYDPNANADAGARLYNDNKRDIIGSHGRSGRPYLSGAAEPNGMDLYMAHQQGYGGYTSIQAALDPKFNRFFVNLDENGRDTYQTRRNILANIGNDVESLTGVKKNQLAGLSDHDLAKTFTSYWQTKYNQIEIPEKGIKAIEGGQPNQSSQSPRPAQTQSNAMADGVLEKGEKGEAVRKLQEALVAAGARDAKGNKITADSDFGDRTKETVENYQRSRGLKVDGEAGPDTLKALRENKPPVQNAPQTSESPSNTSPITAKSSGWPTPGNYTINVADKPREGDGEFGAPRSSGRGHAGIDIVGKVGDPIQSIGPGKVIQAGPAGDVAGNTVIIQHDDGTRSRYLHLDKVQVKPGDRVDADTQIATMGRSGNTPKQGDTHLHFEMYDKGGQLTDPRKFFHFEGEKSKTVEEIQKKLGEQGFKDPQGKPLVADGSYGANTAHAVREFQKANGIEATGVVDPNTLNALRNPKQTVTAPAEQQNQQQPASKPEAQPPAQPAPKPEAQQPAQQTPPAAKPEAQQPAPPATQPTQQTPTQQAPAQPAEKPANPTQPATPAQPAATAGPSVAALQAEGVLTVGAKGADVTALQQRLQDVGLLDKKGVTGTFDETTRQAVMKLEQQAGLSQQPGIYGPKSEQALGKLEQSLVTSEKFADPKAHKLYEQTLELTKTLPAGTFKDEAEQKRAAAAITMELYAAGKTDPQSMALDKKSGTMVFVFESKDPSKDQSAAARTPEPVNMTAAKEMPLSVSSGLIADLGQKQAPQAQTPQTPDVAKPAQANPVQADPQQEPQKPKVMLA